jgi:hypothetical protein
MISFEIGLEAECFLKNKEGEFIPPSSNLPIDGSGNVIEIRSDYSNVPQKTIENFYRKFEQVKELCYPSIIFLSKSELLKKRNFERRAYSYKYKKHNNDISEEFLQRCGLHIHISLRVLNENIEIPENIIIELCKTFDVDLFKIIKYDIERSLTDYRIKYYSKVKSGFEYRSLYFDETVLNKIPLIIKQVDLILQSCNSLKNLAIDSVLGKAKNIEDFDKINIKELYNYITTLNQD